MLPGGETLRISTLLRRRDFVQRVQNFKEEAFYIEGARYLLIIHELLVAIVFFSCRGAR